MNMNQVTLSTNDLKKSIEFYRKMGFLQIVDSPHYARFECTEGNSTFSVSFDENCGNNSSVIYFEHENLDELVSSLKQKGIVFDQDPTDMSHLWREAVLRDPAGNKIKLYWAGDNRLNPPWRVELDA